MEKSWKFTFHGYHISFGTVPYGSNNGGERGQTVEILVKSGNALCTNDSTVWVKQG